MRFVSFVEDKYFMKSLWLCLSDSIMQERWCTVKLWPRWPVCHCWRKHWSEKWHQWRRWSTSPALLRISTKLKISHWKCLLPILSQETSLECLASCFLLATRHTWRNVCLQQVQYRRNSILLTSTLNKYIISSTHKISIFSDILFKNYI